MPDHIGVINVHSESLTDLPLIFNGPSSAAVRTYGHIVGVPSGPPSNFIGELLML